MKLSDMAIWIDSRYCFLLSVGRRSDRSRKRRPVKIVSFDTDNTGNNSAPASNVASPTTLTSSVHEAAVSAKTPTSLSELSTEVVNIVKTLPGDPTSSCHSEAVAVGSLPGDADEPLVSCTALVEASSDELTIPTCCASKLESEYNIFRNSSLPNMGSDFGTDSYGGCSEDVASVSSQDVNDLTLSSSSTVKPDDYDGPQDLPSDNAWFGTFRDRLSSVEAPDAESIASNASTESSSSVNNHTRFVSCCLVHAMFAVLKLTTVN